MQVWEQWSVFGPLLCVGWGPPPHQPHLTPTPGSHSAPGTPHHQAHTSTPSTPLTHPLIFHWYSLCYRLFYFFVFFPWHKCTDSRICNSQSCLILSLAVHRVFGGISAGSGKTWGRPGHSWGNGQEFYGRLYTKDGADSLQICHGPGCVESCKCKCSLHFECHVSLWNVNVNNNEWQDFSICQSSYCWALIFLKITWNKFNILYVHSTFYSIPFHFPPTSG